MTDLLIRSRSCASGQAMTRHGVGAGARQRPGLVDLLSRSGFRLAGQMPVTIIAPDRPKAALRFPSNIEEPEMSRIPARCRNAPAAQVRAWIALPRRNGVL